MPKTTPGTELMNRIYSGQMGGAAPEIVESARAAISDACEELIEAGARIRPLMVGDRRVGWVRGVHVTERKMLGRWFTGAEFVENVLLLATTLTRDELDGCTGREIHILANLVKDMTECDLSLAPYISAFVTTGASECLWHGHAHTLTSFENKVVEMPDGARLKILAPSHHAKLWATLCTYREQNKARLDGMMNAAMIVRPWTGQNIDPFVAELRTSLRRLQVNDLSAWEGVVSTKALDVRDGWAHPDDTKEGLVRELKGMLSGDRHERVMDAFMQQQISAAEAETARIEALQKKHGEMGVTRKGEPVVLTPAQVREREKNLKRGVAAPRDTEISPTAAERIKKY